MNAELFPMAEEKPQEPAQRIHIDFYSMFMRETFGLSSAWRWYLAQSKGKDRQFTLLEGDIPCGVHASGKQKGRTKWPKPNDSATFFSATVPHAQITKFIAEWETKTGNCSECDGTGHKWVGWNAGTGNKYANCHKCGASGKVASAS